MDLHRAVFILSRFFVVINTEHERWFTDATQRVHSSDAIGSDRDPVWIVLICKSEVQVQALTLVMTFEVYPVQCYLLFTVIHCLKVWTNGAA